MGFHYINGGLLDGEAHVGKPEALVYAPDGQGHLQLVALEYVIFADAWTGAEPPMLFGKMFMFAPAPNRYEIPAFYSLHVWLWKDNPAGLFKPFNRGSAATTPDPLLSPWSGGRPPGRPSAVASPA